MKYVSRFPHSYVHILFFQTLYTYPENFRAYKAQIAAQYSGASVKVVSQPPEFKYGETNKSDAFLKKFPTGNVSGSSLILLLLTEIKVILLSTSLY